MIGYKQDFVFFNCVNKYIRINYYKFSNIYCLNELVLCFFVVESLWN